MLDHSFLEGPLAGDLVLDHSFLENSLAGKMLIDHESLSGRHLSFDCDRALVGSAGKPGFDRGVLDPANKDLRFGHEPPPAGLTRSWKIEHYALAPGVLMVDLGASSWDQLLFAWEPADQWLVRNVLPATYFQWWMVLLPSWAAEE